MDKKIFLIINDKIKKLKIILTLYNQISFIIKKWKLNILIKNDKIVNLYILY